MAWFFAAWIVMRSAPFALLLLPVLVLPAAWPQVIANHPFSTALDRAVSLEAGASATDLPHHVHYQLTLYDHKGHRTTGTWEIWRDPQHFIRTDIVAGDFHYTRIEDLALGKQWRHFNTLMPLKIYDLLENYREPEFAASQFAHADPRPFVRFSQVQGSPFDCTGDVFHLRICFDPLAHVLAFAEMYNQSIAWGEWQPLGAHSIPRSFRIYDAGRVMVEATGTAEIVKSFPPGFFAIPPGEPDMGDPADDGATPHKVTGMKPVELQWLYGNILLQLSVNSAGRVDKVKLIDADDNDLIHDAETFARHLTFAPQLQNGVATPFDQVVYLRYAPGFE